MACILSGQFDDFEAARAVVDELLTLGMADEDIETYALNAPGQHALFPIGGDEDADRSARGGENGAVKGAALGGAAGRWARRRSPSWADCRRRGTCRGAYTGAFAGASRRWARAAAHSARPAGVRVVAHVPTRQHRDCVLSTFRRHRARSIEEAEGTWHDGSWDSLSASGDQ